MGSQVKQNPNTPGISKDQGALIHGASTMAPWPHGLTFHHQVLGGLTLVQLQQLQSKHMQAWKDIRKDIRKDMNERILERIIWKATNWDLKFYKVLKVSSNIF